MNGGAASADPRDRLSPVWPIIITVIIIVPLLFFAWMRVRRR